MNEKRTNPPRPPEWPHRLGTHFQFVPENQPLRPQAPPPPQVQPKKPDPEPHNLVAINPRINVRYIPIQHPNPPQIARNRGHAIPGNKIAIFIAVVFSTLIFLLIANAVFRHGENTVPSSSSYSVSSRDNNSNQADRLIRAIDKFLNK
jgi:hypothetical protein